MPTLGSFSAWIMCNGKPLPEYGVVIQDTGKISCWIPSEVGKNFSVHWRDGGSNAHTCAFISLDGFVVPGRFLFGYGSTWRNGVRTSPNTQRPFAFAQQTGTSTSEGQIHPDAGKIILKIRFVTIEGSRMPNSLQQLPGLSGSQGSMLSHCVSYAENMPTYEQYPETWNVKPDGEPGNRSHVTFEFYYRPQEFLVSQGIMPLEHAIPIPPAVRRASAMNRRVASSPFPSSSSSMSTLDSNPSPPVSNSSEQTDQTTDDPGTTRPATHIRAVSQCRNRQDPYPGEGVLDLGLDPNVWRT